MKLSWNFLLANNSLEEIKIMFQHVNKPSAFLSSRDKIRHIPSKIEKTKVIQPTYMGLPTKSMIISSIINNRCK